MESISVIALSRLLDLLRESNVTILQYENNIDYV